MSKDFRGASVWLCLLKSGLFVISADVRVSSWPLMASVWPTIGLTATYLIIVRIGPSVMNCRPHGFEFRWTLFCFNSALVLLNLYIFTEVSLRVAWPLLNTLHWLPVQQRIDYKVALLTFKVLPFPPRNLFIKFGANPSTIFLVIVVTDRHTHRHTNQRR